MTMEKSRNVQHEAIPTHHQFDKKQRIFNNIFWNTFFIDY
jgi:hypothetical protein